MAGKVVPGRRRRPARVPGLARKASAKQLMPRPFLVHIRITGTRWKNCPERSAAHPQYARVSQRVFPQRVTVFRAGSAAIKQGSGGYRLIVKRKMVLNG